MQKSSILRRFLAAAGVVAGAMAAGAFAAEPAAAAVTYGCEYPRVCFYGNSDDASRKRNPTAGYKDAGYWQKLGPRSRGAYAVYNSRDDDTALLKFDLAGNDVVWCVRPNEYLFLNPTEYPGAVVELKISSRATCP
ncbi:hypothetical protein [Couchioplanes caeruleus]|uniref:Peptidase inhibitor family I36 n=2 Tax=Couchioplanes caeruleus TaxID=56438 RepID=A0A1K0FQV3_9ACTN|nr:hypothetical protein [Couchioplanes caeruleus]OJF15064.1 hypothetical protein BG844_06310 [Couchioplanes caeruleus subsp. caeruleus]ROP33931.1 hypothetical protein EDD30_6991 [Couchioplanes caeruleus]